MSDEPKKLIWDNDLHSRTLHGLTPEKPINDTQVLAQPQFVKGLRIEEILSELNRAAFPYPLDNQFTYIKEKYDNKDSCLKEKYIRVPIQSSIPKKRKCGIERILLSLLFVLNLFFLISQNQLITAFQNYSNQQFNVLSGISHNLRELLHRYVDGTNLHITDKLKKQFVKNANDKKNAIVALISRSWKQKERATIDYQQMSFPINMNSINSYRLNHDDVSKEDILTLNPHELNVEDQNFQQNLVDNKFAVIVPLYPNSVDNDDPESIVIPQAIISKNENIVKSSQFIPTSMKKVVKAKEEDGNYSYNDLFGELLQEKQLYKGRKIKIGN